MKQLFFLCLLLISCSEPEDKRLSKIDSILKKLHSQRGFNGNILISEKDKIIYEKSFGYSNFEKQTSLTEKSIFNVASVSKTFTVVAIMMLEEEGLLGLDDNVKKFFPQLPYESITIKNLLTHTSGLLRVQSPPFRKLIEGRELTNRSLLKTYIETAPELVHEPGTDYFYSNMNYYLLALIIEDTSNQSYDHFLNSRIFEKAGMQETFLKARRVPNLREESVVSNHTRPSWLATKLQSTKDSGTERSETSTFANVYGASEIHTTAKDLFKFHTALQNQILLRTETLKKMHSAYLLENKEYTVDEKSNYPSHRALGWCVSKEFPEIVYHSGGTYGARSFFIRNTAKNQSVVILTNNQEMNRYNFTFPMRILNGEPYKLDPISLPKLFCSEYLENGISAALESYRTYDKNPEYKAFVSWDFEEIGQELTERGDTEAAVALYRLYTEKFPDEYSWELLGNALVEDNKVEEAKECFKKSITINPKYESAIDALNRLKLISK